MCSIRHQKHQRLWMSYIRMNPNTGLTILTTFVCCELHTAGIHDRDFVQKHFVSKAGVQIRVTGRIINANSLRTFRPGSLHVFQIWNPCEISSNISVNDLMCTLQDAQRLSNYSTFTSFFSFNNISYVLRVCFIFFLMPVAS